jgi:hypothetical protein
MTKLVDQLIFYQMPFIASFYHQWLPFYERFHKTLHAKKSAILNPPLRESDATPKWSSSGLDIPRYPRNRIFGSVAFFTNLHTKTCFFTQGTGLMFKILKILEFEIFFPSPNPSFRFFIFSTVLLSSKV